MIVITMENGAQIKAELYPEHAPITVDDSGRLPRRHRHGRPRLAH